MADSPSRLCESVPGPASTTVEPFGIAILGTGIMGRRMIAALQPHPRFRVVALWDPDAVALRTALDLAPGARAARDVQGLITGDDVKAVYIASPPGLHLRGVAAVVASGRPCLCEKPLAADVDEAAALRDLVAASGLPFAVNFPFASGEASTRLIALVRSGALGRVTGASITLRFAQWPRPWQTGASTWLSGAAEGGFTREVLSHFVFLAQRLFGPATVSDVELRREPGRAETVLRARLAHADVSVGIDAAVAGTVADQNRFEVVGKQGMAALVDWARLDYQGRISDRVDTAAKSLDAFAALLDGRGDHGLATVDEALAVVRCVEAMQR